MDESALIQRILQGSRQDFALLVNKYQANVFRTAMGLVHSQQDAEEITQDVFVKVFDKLSSFNGKSAFSTWLYRIAVNISLNFLRKRKRTAFWVSLTEMLQVPSKDKSTEILMTEKSDNAIIQHAMDRLPEKQRLAFVLTKYEDLPQKKVAEIMDISEGAVEQLIIRARTNLQKNLLKDLPGHRILLTKIV